VVQFSKELYFNFHLPSPLTCSDRSFDHSW